MTKESKLSILLIIIIEYKNRDKESIPPLNL